MKTFILVLALLCNTTIAFADTLYSIKGCGACAVAKKALDANCIKYKIVDIDQNNPLNLDAAPVYVTDDKQTLTGSYQIEAWANGHNRCGK